MKMANFHTKQLKSKASGVFTVLKEHNLAFKLYKMVKLYNRLSSVSSKIEENLVILWGNVRIQNQIALIVWLKLC